MPFIILCALALTSSVVVALLAYAYPHRAPAVESARKVGEEIGEHRRLRAMLDARLDPETATGLALTLSLAFAIAAGVLFAALAFLVRAHTPGIDRSVAKWGHDHATAFSTHAVNAVTQLGSTPVVVGLGVVVVVVVTIVQRTAWAAPFMIAVLAGEETLSNTVKHLADRVRPAFNPAAASLGPSFPSGHTTAAAAFWAAVALLIGRPFNHGVRSVLAGLAAGTAVAVAASRVFLDVHWVTDVVAGLALGWLWFTVCAIAFGGRILRFGAGAEITARAAEAAEAAEESRDGSANVRPRSPRPRAARRG